MFRSTVNTQSLASWISLMSARSSASSSNRMIGRDPHGRPVSRLPLPTRPRLVVPEAHGEILHESVKRYGSLRAERASGCDVLGRKYLEEEAEVRPVTRRGGAEVSR